MKKLLLLLLLFTSCTTYSPLDTDTPHTREGRYLVVGDALSDTGIILYPGGLVAPEAYLAPAWEISQASGALVVIVPMLLNLAVLSPNRGISAMMQFSSIEQWYIAGHSLGGAMAASVLENHQELFSGLILLGAYPARSSKLHGMEVRILSIYAEHDGLADQEKIENSRTLLPDDTRFFMIPGGNHAQFGNYGEQKRDGDASIPPSEQWRIVAEGIREFIQGNL